MNAAMRGLPRAQPTVVRMLAAAAQALLAHCRERLAPYKLPAQWQFAQQLPKTPANKTDKNALRRSIT